MELPNTPFAQELRSLLNRHSQENKSNTPDFILATYLLWCMTAFNQAVNDRDAWYGVQLHPGNNDVGKTIGDVISAIEGPPT